MKIQPNYLYRVLPGLAKAGEVSRDGQGWHPGESSSPASATSAPRTTPRRRTRAAKPGAKTPAATRRSRRNRRANTANTHPHRAGHHPDFGACGLQRR